MTLSLLRSWRRTTDSDLVSRVRQVSPAPVRLSRCYRTQAVYQRNLYSVACTIHSPLACHQSSNSPTRRLCYHQTAAERSEPGAVSLTPAEATTGYQIRRLRARRLSEVNSSDLTAIEATQSLDGKPKPHKVPGRKDKKLGRVTRATHTVRPGREAEASEIRKEENQDFIKDRLIREPYDAHSDYWGPVYAADVEHLEAVQTAQRAAQKAENLQRQAKEATDAASAAKFLHDEELAALVSKQKAKLAAEKERTYEAVRAELRAGQERQPVYWDSNIRSKFGMSSWVRALIHASCQICHAKHSLSHCPLLFRALDCKERPVPKYIQRLFKDKLALDKEFREAILYIQTIFTVSKGSIVEVIPLSSKFTKNAPPSAIKYLQEFDNRVYFRSIFGEGEKDRPEFSNQPSRAWDCHSGYYITNDDDGMPIAIFFPRNAPSNIATDPHFWPEIQKIRSFTAHWRKRAKSSFGQDPFADIPSISIIICRGRWHQTTSFSIDPFRSVLSLYISNEKLWNQGLYYRGIHIGTKDDEITSEYDWWSYGRREVNGTKWTDTRLTPIHSATSEAHVAFASDLLRATVRSVEETVQPILAGDVQRVDPDARLRYGKYLRTASRRGAIKYGKASVQYLILWTSLAGSSKTEHVTAMLRKGWAPSWRILMRLDHDNQELGLEKPRPLPKRRPRKRLLHPRPSSASDSASTDRLPGAQDYHMRSSLSPGIAPETGTGGNGGVETPVSRPVSTPRVSQREYSKHRTRRILSPVDSASDNTTDKLETGENSARRVSTPGTTPWTTSRPHNPGYVPKGLLSALSATPELMVDTSALEAAGPDAVNFSRGFRSRRGKEMKKSRKTKTGHELPVTGGSNACSF